MILLLSMTEADCLDRQHRRVTGATNRCQRRRSAYRASGLVPRCMAVIPCRRLGEGTGDSPCSRIGKSSPVLVIDVVNPPASPPTTTAD
ncbi:hypothetical protein [Sphaerotilus microaerophilus]|uniref:hypothetical protein n=1 Tax=Sphaerotilus microaerophilus TaxID=2914710 RepID=UPI002073CEC8|nr:hypothetical protein [Sphaerotilus sp. FB-5]